MGVKKNLNKKKKEKIKGWHIKVLIEGAKEAGLLAREEQLPAPDESYDIYPVDLEIPKTLTFLQMIRKVMTYSKMGIYSSSYKDP